MRLIRTLPPLLFVDYSVTAITRRFFSMTGDFDLLGDPIPKNWGERGRPPHFQTEKKRNKIRYLLALGWTNTRIARALNITGAPRRKYYFRQLRQRDEARQRGRKLGRGGGQNPIIETLVRIMQRLRYGQRRGQLSPGHRSAPFDSFNLA